MGMGKHAVLFQTLQSVHDVLNSCFGASFIPPTDALFRLAYGEWALHTVDDWQEVYLKHDREVREFFREDGPYAGRLLPISFVKGEGWDELAPFLNLSGAPAGPFPR